MQIPDIDWTAVTDPALDGLVVLRADLASGVGTSFPLTTPSPSRLARAVAPYMAGVVGPLDPPYVVAAGLPYAIDDGSPATEPMRWAVRFDDVLMAMAAAAACTDELARAAIVATLPDGDSHAVVAAIPPVPELGRDVAALPHCATVDAAVADLRAHLAAHADAPIRLVERRSADAYWRRAGVTEAEIAEIHAAQYAGMFDGNVYDSPAAETLAADVARVAPRHCSAATVDRLRRWAAGAIDA